MTISVGLRAPLTLSKESSENLRASTIILPNFAFLRWVRRQQFTTGGFHKFEQLNQILEFG